MLYLKLDSPWRLGESGRYPTKAMTPTLQQFVRDLAALGGDAEAWAYDDGPPPCLTCPAIHPDVGPLLIYDDRDELTVCLDKKHHSHISTYNYLQKPESERLNLVALEAAQFVIDIFSDRVLFTVDYIGTECRGSSHFYLDETPKGVESLRVSIGLRGGNIRTERYLWSGPYNSDVG